MEKILVSYFSASGVTKKVANNHVLLVTKSGAYVTADVDGKLSLTSDIAKAKLFAFEEVTAMTALNVGQLTYYDLDTENADSNRVYECYVLEPSKRDSVLSILVNECKRMKKDINAILKEKDKSRQGY